MNHGLKDESEEMKDLYSIPDDTLIEMAKQKRTDAFGELVRRHRAKAYGWAKKWTHDPYLAEDIVQEALLNAFLHIHHLLDSSKFSAWFYRIVSNQGNMKLRRGGNFGRENPFASLTKEESVAFDWANIDHILMKLSKSVHLNPSFNPVEQLIRKETLLGLKTMLHCLSKRERAIFEGYFFEQLSPREISDLFDTKVSNVYNLLSRSKQKIQRERIRVTVQQHVETRNQNGLPKKRVLDSSKIL
ncbi:RNA polymerase sigma factor [Salinibacillus xinjiangensis]|uniref:RNA polymerase sigma factor n=1 Tax=Salinibacillus xinjiangensis TaxID=1229268 RepID=UPI00189121D7|nr:RNA polymerase sigma factor [Salinibacillus xinjiangensis]